MSASPALARIAERHDVAIGDIVDAALGVRGLAPEAYQACRAAGHEGLGAQLRAIESYEARRVRRIRDGARRVLAAIEAGSPC